MTIHPTWNDVEFWTPIWEAVARLNADAARKRARRRAG